MLHTCIISGSLFHHDQPAHGLLRFVPNRLWVIQDGVTWACLAPEVQLDPDGSFVAQVTATDSDAIMWTYQILFARYLYEVHVPWNEAGWSLKELISEHHPGPRSPHRR